MGTNYYAIPKLSEDKRKEIAQMVLDNKVLEARNELPVPVHIGKQSAGWQFIFNHNDWQYFDRTLESLDLFLKNCEIEDEYGTPVTYEKFWSGVNATKGMLDGKEYYTNWGKYNKDFITGNPLPEPPYIPVNYGEEKHFGLTFSDSIDFS